MYTMKFLTSKKKIILRSHICCSDRELVWDWGRGVECSLRGEKAMLGRTFAAEVTRSGGIRWRSFPSTTLGSNTVVEEGGCQLSLDQFITKDYHSL